MHKTKRSKANVYKVVSMLASRKGRILGPIDSITETMERGRIGVFGKLIAPISVARKMAYRKTQFDIETVISDGKHMLVTKIVGAKIYNDGDNIKNKSNAHLAYTSDKVEREVYQRIDG